MKFLHKILFVQVLLVSTVPLFAADTTSWTFIDKFNEEITCEWIQKGHLIEERDVFVRTFSAAYKDFSLQMPDIKSLPEFLNESFNTEVADLNGGIVKVYVLSAKNNSGKVIGYASFNETEISGQVYVRRMAVDPLFAGRGIGKEMIF